ncbi:MAG: hypothetical protein WCF85_19250, partial [Rhodospirillaceae bacterium]
SAHWASLGASLVQISTDCFPGPGDGQNGELKRPRSEPDLRPDGSHERSDLGIRQSRVVLDFLHLGAGRQQQVEITAPASRVLTLDTVRAWTAAATAKRSRRRGGDGLFSGPEWLMLHVTSGGRHG